MDAAQAITSANIRTPSTATDKAAEGLGSVDFMNILIKQLQYQDPFEPMSNQDMVAQMATIRELEMNSQLTDKLASLTEQQRYGAAAALIGKYSEGSVSDSAGNEYPLAGMVQGIQFTSDGAVMLELHNGQVLPLADLQKVTDPSSMVGKYVEGEGLDVNGGRYSAAGTVDGVRLDSEFGVLLELANGQTLRLADVKVIADTAPIISSQG